MFRVQGRLTAGLLTFALALLALPTAMAGPVAGAASQAPAHDIVVTGPGDSLAPGFDQATARYSLRTGGASVAVEASTTDPAGVVRVNGRPVTPGEPATVSDLADGDEVSVLITDSAGTAAYSLVRVPESFPAVDVVTHGDGTAPGLLFLGLTDFFGGDRFEAVVDANGVPVHLRRATNSMDFKLQPNGSYSVARADNTDLVTPYDIVELNSRFEEIASHRTVGLANTDFHDALPIYAGTSAKHGRARSYQSASCSAPWPWPICGGKRTC